MEIKYIIFDLANNKYFVGSDRETGHPLFYEDVEPVLFDSEQEALERLDDEIELFGKWFLLERLIEIKKIYIY